jgi:TP901 family phage tail tape measure protein
MADTTLRFVLVADTTQFNAKMKAAISGLATVGTKGEKSMKKVTRGTGTLMNMLTRARGVILSVGVSLATIGTIRIFGSLMSQVANFQQAFIGVQKTVTATEAEFEQLRREFVQMSTEIPFTAAELSKIGQIAGQLGVAAEDIAKFTRVVADLSIAAEDLDIEQAAFSLARLSKIMNTNIGDAGRMSSAIVDLGNNFATTEGEITEMALRMGAAGRVIGLAAPEVLGLATSLTQLGIKAQAGGTALSKAFIQMKKAVDEGGDTLEDFATVAGISAEEFAQQFRTAPVQAITMFVEGLGRIVTSGGSAFTVLERLGLSNIRVARAMLSTASAAGETRKAIALATKAWNDNTAATKEAEKFYASWINRLKVVGNQILAIADRIGQVLIPIFVEFAEVVVKPFDDMRKAMDEADRQVPEFAKSVKDELGTLSFAWNQYMENINDGILRATVAFREFVLSNLEARLEVARTSGASAKEIATLEAKIRDATLAVKHATVAYEVWESEVYGVGLVNRKLIEDLAKLDKAYQAGSNRVSSFARLIGVSGEKLAALILKHEGSLEVLEAQTDIFIKLSAAVDEGVISQEQLVYILSQVAETGRNANIFLEANEFHAKAAALATDEAREAAEKYIEKMEEALEKSSHGADNLAKRMDYFEKAGHSAEVLVATFGEELAKLADIQNQSGKEISASAAKWLQLKADWERAIPVLDELGQVLIGTGKRFGDLSPTIEDTAEAMEHIDKIIKTAMKEIDENADPTLKALMERIQGLKEEIVDLATSHENLGILIEQLEEMGITGPQAAKLLETDIKKLVKAFEILGIAVPENLQQWLAWVEQMDKAEKEAKRVAGIIDGVITRAFNDFTKTIADAIVDWKGFWSGLVDIAKSFAKSLIRVLLTEMFNPMMGIVKSIGQALSGALFGGGFGKGKGSFFSNVAGLFTGGGAAGGIREVAGVGTGGGLAGKAGMGGSAGLGAMSTSFATMKLNAIAAGEAIWKFVTMTTALGPLGAVIGGVAAGVYGLYIWLRKTTEEKLVDEFARDFGGIQTSEQMWKDFVKTMGLTMETAKGIRKDLSSSPIFLKMSYDLAEAQGRTGQFLASLEKVETAWGTFNFRTAFEEGLNTGDWTALNKAFTDAFESSEALAAAFNNDLGPLLLEIDEEAHQANETIKALDQSLTDLRAQPDNVAASLENMVFALEHLQSVGATNDEILQLLGEDLVALVQGAQELGVEIPQLVMDFYNLASAMEGVNENFSKGVAQWEAIKNAGMNLADIVKGFVSASMEDLKINLEDAGAVLDYQRYVWSLFGNDILSVANATTKAGQAVDPFIKLILDWAVAQGLINKELDGTYKLLEDVDAVMSKGAEMWHENAQAQKDFSGLVYQWTVAAMEDLNITLDDTQGILQLQHLAWETFGKDALDLANAAIKANKEVDPFIQNILDWGMRAGFVIAETDRFGRTLYKFASAADTAAQSYSQMIDAIVNPPEDPSVSMEQFAAIQPYARAVAQDVISRIPSSVSGVEKIFLTSRIQEWIAAQMRTGTSMTEAVDMIGTAISHIEQAGSGKLFDILARVVKGDGTLRVEVTNFPEATSREGRGLTIARDAVDRGEFPSRAGRRRHYGRDYVPRDMWAFLQKGEKVTRAGASSEGQPTVVNVKIEGPIYGLDDLDRKISDSVRRTYKGGGLGFLRSE